LIPLQIYEMVSSLNEIA